MTRLAHVIAAFLAWLTLPGRTGRTWGEDE